MRRRKWKLYGTRTLKLLPHQIIAIRFALPRRRGYLALDPGLGKTPIAATITRLLRLPTVYVCPPFLVKNVENEYRRWAPGLRVEVYSKLALQDLRQLDVLIVPDSVLARVETWNGVDAFLACARSKPGDASIDRVECTPALLIVDEAHRFKESGSKRTEAVFGGPSRRGRPEQRSKSGRVERKAVKPRAAIPALVRLFQRRLFMSGTPIPNRPMELYPLLASEAPECIDFMDRFEFGLRFCGGKRTPFGWDFKGATNIPELKARTQGGPWPYMLRQRKELLNLPPKLEEVFILSADMSPQLARLDAEVAEAFGGDGGQDSMRRMLAEGQGVHERELHTASYRRLLGLEKIKPSVEYISALLEDTTESILVIAYHKEVVAGLVAALDKWQPYVITGDTPKDRRQKIVDEFQASKIRRLMIGNYIAMGVGFTLTKATRVVLVEYSWVPGENQQVIDRAHRIGQTESVLAQYVCFANTVDARQLNAILEKSQVTKSL